MKRFVVVVSLLLVLGSLNVYPSPSAQAQTPSGEPPAQTPKGEADEQMRNATIVQQQGTRLATGGCSFADSVITLTPEAPAKAARELATDRQRCTRTLEVGEPITTVSQAQTGGASIEGASRVVPSSPSATSPAAPGGVRSAANVTTSGRYDVWWEDAFTIKVTETWSRLSFTYDTGCVVGSGGGYYLWWNTKTFWESISFTAQLTRTPYGWCVPTSDNTQRSRYATNSVDSTFKNGRFCALFDT